jgi:hypothetical protein
MSIALVRRRSSLGIPVLWTAVFLAVCCGGTAAIAAASTPKPKPSSHLAGTWSGKYSGAYSGTFTLHWTQTKSKLTGTITLSNPRGKYGIDGSVKGGAISFGVVGAGATYTGSVSGTSMSGKYKSPGGNGTWSAHKTS